MECPRCGEKTIVINTRGRADSSVRRIRLCEKGHRFVTIQKHNGRETVREPELARGK